MLQALRDKSTGWLTAIVLGLVVLALGLSGLQGYVEPTTETYVAKVGEQEITPQEYGQQFERYRQRFIEQGMDAAEFSKPERKREFLDGMVSQEIFRQVAQASGLTMSKRGLQREIASTPSFQVEGKFNQDTFVAVLRQNNLTPDGYADLLRNDYLMQIMPRSVVESGFVTDKSINNHVRLRDQTRNFRWITLDSADLSAPVAPTDGELNAYYKANPSAYMSEEKVDLEYVRVRADTLPPSEPLTEARLRKVYDDDSKPAVGKASRFKSVERRQASHILVEVTGGVAATPDALKTALAAAQALAERARKGEDFAALAKANSKDLGSASDGGDLGWLEKGVTEPAFEARLFQMKEGEVSDPVLTGQGYHIIKLATVEAERVKAFDEVRTDLEAEMLKTEKDSAFNTLSGKLVDAILRDPQSLVGASKELSLPLERTGPIGRAGAAEGVAANPEALKAGFSEIVLARGQNSNLINLGTGDVVVVRAAAHEKSVLKPFDAVKLEVQTALQNERRAAALKTRGEELLKALRGGKTLDALATELKKTVEVADGAGRNAANQDPKLVEEIFKTANPGAKPTPIFAVLGPERVALAELQSIKDGDPKSLDSASRDALRSQLGSEVGQAEMLELRTALKGKATVEVREDRL